MHSPLYSIPFTSLICLFLIFIILFNFIFSLIPLPPPSRQRPFFLLSVMLKMKSGNSENDALFFTFILKLTFICQRHYSINFWPIPHVWFGNRMVGVVRFHPKPVTLFPLSLFLACMYFLPVGEDWRWMVISLTKSNFFHRTQLSTTFLSLLQFYMLSLQKVKQIVFHNNTNNINSAIYNFNFL